MSISRYPILDGRGWLREPNVWFAERKATLDNPVQRPAGCGQPVYPLAHGSVFDQRRGVMRLAAGVDHQRAAAAPVFAVDERFDAVHVAAGLLRVKVTQRKLFNVRA